MILPKDYSGCAGIDCKERHECKRHLHYNNGDCYGAISSGDYDREGNCNLKIPVDGKEADD
jgi:hypothetical protein